MNMKFASFMPSVKSFSEAVRSDPLKVEVLTDGLHLTHNSPYTGESAIELEYAKLFKPKTKYVILFSPLKGLLCFEHGWLFKSKSNWPSLRDTHYAIEVVANLYFHDSAENGLLFVNTQPVVTDGSIEFVQPKTSPVRVHDYIARQFPADEDVVAHNTNLRIEALTELSDIDSIVALEQQVDLLTVLVKALLNGETPPQWTQAFMGATSESAAYTIRAPETLIDDLAAHKAKVRAAQRHYLENRKV
jgi:hypothetical protein